jgi:hypothetical protein
VSWHEWARPRKDSTSSRTAEVILPLTGGAGGRGGSMLHIFITADATAQVGELKKIVGTLKR